MSDNTTLYFSVVTNIYLAKLVPIKYAALLAAFNCTMCLLVVVRGQL